MTTRPHYVTHLAARALQGLHHTEPRMIIDVAKHAGLTISQTEAGIAYLSAQRAIRYAGGPPAHWLKPAIGTPIHT